MNLAKLGEELMSFPKDRKLKCEICENREAVYIGLCENCAEGTTRSVSIQPPKKGNISRRQRVRRRPLEMPLAPRIAGNEAEAEDRSDARTNWEVVDFAPKEFFK